MGVAARARVHYGVVVVAATFLVLLIAAGFRSTPGVLLKPLEDAVRLEPRATIGGAVSVNLLCYGLGAPFAAAIVERFGIRRVCAGAPSSIVAAGAALTTQMTEPWQLYVLWGVVVGTATGAIAMPLAAIVANRWFVARRGLVTGLLAASNASGQLVFLPLLAVARDELRLAGGRPRRRGRGGVRRDRRSRVVFLRDRPERRRAAAATARRRRAAVPRPRRQPAPRRGRRDPDARRGSATSGCSPAPSSSAARRRTA